MSEYESNKPTIGQNNHRKEPDVPEMLATTILAHLGLSKDVPSSAFGTIPAWHRQVIAVQKLAETCTAATVRPVVEALEKDLGQRQKVVRMAVVRALGKIYLSFPGHVRWELFMRSLADPSSEVRATTVQVFMAFVSAPQARPPHAQALERLAKHLSQLGRDGRAYEDEAVNISIIQLMGLLGDLAPATAVAAIVFIAGNQREDWPLREAAILALGLLYPGLSAQQRQGVSQTLYDPHPFVRQAAIQVLRERVPVREVFEVLQTGERRIQVCAAQVLGQWGEHLALGTIALDPHAASALRTAALLGLAHLAQTQDLVIKRADLKHLVDEGDASVRVAAEMLREVLEARRPPSDEKKKTG
ncbi:MAG TPA: hypothetical protein VGF67_14135 [Ktedonobacteraceae bacterium]|jgi:HEAT repeat protein